MASEKKGLFSRSIILGLVVLMTQIVFVLSLVSPQSLEETIQTEVRMMVSAYGVDSATVLYKQAESDTSSIMDESGAIDYLRHMLLPREYLWSGSVQDKKIFNTSFWDVIDNAIQNLYLNVEFAMLRIQSFSQWIAMFVIMVLASGATGYLQREIKKQGFDYSSPLRHGLSRKWIYFTPVVIYIVLFVPIAIHPFIYPVLMAVMAFAIATYISNTIKRV